MSYASKTGTATVFNKQSSLINNNGSASMNVSSACYWYGTHFNVTNQPDGRTACAVVMAVVNHANTAKNKVHEPDRSRPWEQVSPPLAFDGGTEEENMPMISLTATPEINS